MRRAISTQRPTRNRARAFTRRATMIHIRFRVVSDVFWPARCGIAAVLLRQLRLRTCGHSIEQLLRGMDGHRVILSLGSMSACTLL